MTTQTAIKDESTGDYSTVYVNTGSHGTNMSVSTSIPLFTGLEIPNQYALAKLNLKAALADLEKAKEDISINIASAYLQVLFNEELHRVSLGQVELSKEQCNRIDRLFCRGDTSTAFPASPDIDGIFRPLYGLPKHLRLPYFRLKVQELLLFLSRLSPEDSGLAQYQSRQTALMQEIHHQLTEHLDRRYTIEELSRQYLINTSSLKETFKGVYGMPIATYMKDYRIHKAMELLQHTDESIAEIAAKIGYETQGKFTKTFKEFTDLTPSTYRKKYREGTLPYDRKRTD